MTAPFLSVVIPVRNEQENIGPMLAALRPHLPESHEIIVVAVHQGDPTLMAVPSYCRRTWLWKPGGVAEQLKAGFRYAQGDAILVTMADLCDDPADIREMLVLIKDHPVVPLPPGAPFTIIGFDMVCASRYMKGGRQIGTPRVKSWLSWAAGWSLHVLGLPTHDPSNSYKLYRASKLKALDLNGSLGFDLNLEIVLKALENGWRITEVPTTWRGRTHGDSSFRFWRWLPFYARWWVKIAWRLICST